MQPLRLFLMPILALACFGVADMPAAAAEITVAKSEQGDSYLSISGRIAIEDGKKFTQAALSSDAATVFLNSAGGSIDAAIEIGRVIRLKGMSTVVAQDDYCVSACGLIWLAGERRFLTPNARVGFHATYVTKDSVRVESGTGNALVGRYLTLLNLPERAVIFTTVAGPNKLNWLNASNKIASGIDLDILGDSANTSRSTMASLAKPPLLTASSLQQEEEQSYLQVIKR